LTKRRRNSLAGERKIVADKVKRVLLKEYLMEETKRAGFGGLDIQRTPMGTRVTLFTERPGLVIGRRGGAVKDLTDAIENRFKFDNPQIEVQEVENPSLNAQIMAEKLASALERGWQFRRAGHSTVRRIMGAGAKGCLIVISGKLTGQRHRTEKFKEGHIKFCGETRLIWMDEGFAVAKLKPGVLGLKVRIMRKDAKLPDEIEIAKTQAERDVETELKAEAEAAVASQQAEAEKGKAEEKATEPPAEPKPEQAAAKEAASHAPAERKEQSAKQEQARVPANAEQPKAPAARPAEPRPEKRAEQPRAPEAKPAELRADPKAEPPKSPVKKPAEPKAEATPEAKAEQPAAPAKKPEPKAEVKADGAAQK
jgi:small subunit ribosomal protein S3